MSKVKQKNKRVYGVYTARMCLLAGILQRRIEYDKEVLFQFTQLRKEANIAEPNAAVAPVLIKFSGGCEKVSRTHTPTPVD